jgi:MFS family permease
MNAGFILGPFQSTRILEKFDFSAIFFVSLIINAIIFVVALVGLRGVNHDFKRELSIGKLLKQVFRRKNVMRIYYISFVLTFFYALMVIFTPLYLLDLGMTWGEIGFIFTGMLMPFIVFQYPMGVLADKKMGEKELIIGALILMGISTTAIYFTQSTSIAVWIVILFLTRMGAACTEVLRDSYFFKRIDSEDVDIIDFFRTSRSVAYIAVAVLTAILLLFLPLKSVFLLLVVVIFSGLYPAFKLVDNMGEEEAVKN